MRLLFRVQLLLVICILGVSANSRASDESFLDTVKNTDTAFDNRAVPLERQVVRESVLAEEEYQGGSFRVLTRKNEIERYKCSSCHTKKPVTVNQGMILTHGDVVLKHGTAGTLECIDCHHPEERDFLEDKKGRKIDFDHSYQLCGQCHFRQKSDWVGGAHGKRVSNWAGERVVYNCTTCHNPHSPRFEKRFPATFSVPLN